MYDKERTTLGLIGYNWIDSRLDANSLRSKTAIATMHGSV